MAALWRRSNLSWPSWRHAGYPSAALSGWLALLLFGPLAGPLRSETIVARPYLIDGWQTESGLPQNTVTGIAQTPDGYLWVSTFDGVARFDGFHFKTFNAGNTPGLGSGRIRFLFKGRQGVLWLSPQEGGLIRLRTASSLRLWCRSLRAPGSPTPKWPRMPPARSGSRTRMAR